LLLPISNTIVLQIKRLHDFICSGWWILISFFIQFIPTIGNIASIRVVAE
jgi:uncharacterized membrane protein YhaH (DUF805 family)